MSANDSEQFNLGADDEIELFNLGDGHESGDASSTEKLRRLVELGARAREALNPPPKYPIPISKPKHNGRLA